MRGRRRERVAVLVQVDLSLPEPECVPTVLDDVFKTEPFVEHDCRIDRRDSEDEVVEVIEVVDLHHPILRLPVGRWFRCRGVGANQE